MQLTMSQFRVITSAPVDAVTQTRVRHAWLTGRILEAQRLLADAGLPYTEVGEIITELAKSNVERKWRS